MQTRPYVARYTSASNSDTTEIELSAANDTAAAEEVNRMVESGYRNETCCQVELRDGRTYGASNQHGRAIGGYL